MSFIPWATIPLDCRQNSMQFRPDNTLLLRQYKTSKGTGSNWTSWGFHLTGTAKYVLLIPPITNGHNGYSFSFLIPGTIRAAIKRSASKHLLKYLKKRPRPV